jgi:crotonobetainyl-CoA:carnitine CoA-transferase CaiB-like acyl-CoA transferase
MSDAGGRRRAHDAIDRGLSAWTTDRDADTVASLLVAAGVPAATVVAPRDIASNPQLRSRALFEVEHHAVTGDHEIPMLPFRFGRVDRWLRRPAPTLGQDNDAVLADIGLSPGAVERLRQAGVAGERLADA